MKLLKLFMAASLAFLPGSIALAHDNHTVMKGTKATTKSLYLVQSNWTNYDNKTLKLLNFKGKPVIMTMLYTTCKNSCPLIMSQLKLVEKSLKGGSNKISFVVVSLDPARDTPETLSKFALKHGARASNWYYLNGSTDNVTELAALLGIKFKKTPDGEYMHTNKITVLNKDGEITAQEENFNGKQSKIVQAANKEISGK